MQMCFCWSRSGGGQDSSWQHLDDDVAGVTAASAWLIVRAHFRAEEMAQPLKVRLTTKTVRARAFLLIFLDLDSWSSLLTLCLYTGLKRLTFTFWFWPKGSANGKRLLPPSRVSQKIQTPCLSLEDKSRDPEMLSVFRP